MSADPPLCVQEALLDTLNEWHARITHAQRVQLSEAITRICLDQHRADMAQRRAREAREMARPGWPIERAAIFANAEGRN